MIDHLFTHAQNSKKQYLTLDDVIDDPLFADIDYRLRGGVNITSEDDRLHTFLGDTESVLRKFYGKLHLVLEVTPEQVYYLRPQRRSNVPTTRLNQLEMVMGLTIVAMQWEKNATDFEWIPVDFLIERLKSQLSDERFAELYRLKPGIQTDHDIGRVKEETLKRLSRLSRLSFIKLNRDEKTFWATNAIYRFVEPLKGLSSEDELPGRISSLIQEGFLTDSPSPREQLRDTPGTEFEHWSSEGLISDGDSRDMFDVEEYDD